MKDVGYHLRYEPETGDLWWLIRRQGRRRDQPAGSIITDSKRHQRRIIMLDGVKYPAAILAWRLMTGEWPDREVDHINTNSTDDRWSNLRLATHQQNCMNKRAKGASFHKASGRWRAYIKRGGQQIALGYFDTADKAHEAYRKAAIEMFGEFAYTKGR